MISQDKYYDKINQKSSYFVRKNKYNLPLSYKAMKYTQSIYRLPEYLQIFCLI